MRTKERFNKAAHPRKDAVMNRLEKIVKPFEKERRTAGESLVETLIALLIAALALMMLAGAISSTSRVIETSEKKMQAYYSANNDMVDKNASASKVASKDLTLQLVPSGTDSTNDPVLTVTGVPCYFNTEFSDHMVINYVLPTRTPVPTATNTPVPVNNP